MRSSICTSQTVPILAPWCSVNSGAIPAGLGHRGAAQAEAGGGGGEVAAAVHRFLGRDAVGAELVHLGAIAAVVHDRHQHLDALAADRLQLLHVHHQGAVALDQQHLAVAARGGDADGGGQRRADGAEIVDHVIALGRAALHVGHHHAEVVAGADDDLPVLRDRLVELEHRLARIDGVGLHREFLAVGRVARDQPGHLVGAEAGAARCRAASCAPGSPRRLLWRRRGHGGRRCAGPATGRAGWCRSGWCGRRDRGSRPRWCSGRAPRRRRSPGRPRRSARARSRWRRRRRCRAHRDCRRTGPCRAATSPCSAPASAASASSAGGGAGQDRAAAGDQDRLLGFGDHVDDACRRSQDRAPAAAPRAPGRRRACSR